MIQRKGFTIKAKKLYDTFGDKLKTDKKEFYRKVECIRSFNISCKDFPNTSKWISNCYNRPQTNEIRMEALNELLEMHGVECISGNETKCGAMIEYLNAGDPYVSTVIRCRLWVNPYRLAMGGWGDYVK